MKLLQLQINMHKHTHLHVGLYCLLVYQVARVS